MTTGSFLVFLAWVAIIAAVFWIINTLKKIDRARKRLWSGFPYQNRCLECGHTEVIYVVVNLDSVMEYHGADHEPKG